MGQGFRPRPGIARLAHRARPGSSAWPRPRRASASRPRPGIDAIRAKGIALTEYAIALHDAWLAPLGFTLGSPREAARRGVARLGPARRRAGADAAR